MSSDDLAAPLTREERAVGQLLLIQLHEELDVLRAWALGKPRSPGLPAVPPWVLDSSALVAGEGPQERLRRWAVVFADELDIVRAARNNAAHGLPIDDADLISAVNVAGKLLQLAHVSGGEPESDGSLRFSDFRALQALRFGHQPA